MYYLNFVVIVKRQNLGSWEILQFPRINWNLTLREPALYCSPCYEIGKARKYLVRYNEKTLWLIPHLLAAGPGDSPLQSTVHCDAVPDTLHLGRLRWPSPISGTFPITFVPDTPGTCFRTLMQYYAGMELVLLDNFSIVVEQDPELSRRTGFKTF